MNLINIDHINQKDKDLTELFVYSKTIPKYILGVNKLTKSVQKFVRVDGVIDDFTRVQTSRNKNILHINDITKDAIILVVSTGSPLEVAQKLDDMGLANFNYLSFYRFAPFDLLAPPFMIDFADDFKNNRDKYEATYHLLADDISKKIFTKIINFKLTFDIEFMHGFTNDHTGQYFDKQLIQNIKNLTFVDGGGYIGDTTQQVMVNFPDFKKIYLIEPNKKKYQNSPKKARTHRKYYIFKYWIVKQKSRIEFQRPKVFF
jgi:hypothetical protein